MSREQEYIKLESFLRQDHKKHSAMASVSKDAYQFKYTKRGRAVIICNGRFWYDSGFANRPGASADLKRMQKLFTRLGFSVKDYKNLTAGEIEDRLKKIAVKEKEKHEKKHDADCFVCVISSHGEQVAEVEKRNGVREIHRHQEIAGVDGKTVRTADLVALFNEKNCKSLKGKPKLFFIQACRSNKYVEISDNDGWDLGVDRPSDPDVKQQKEKHDRVDAKVLYDNQTLSDSEYDTSDMEPDSDYDDPDYELQKTTQDNNQTIKNVIEDTSAGSIKKNEADSEIELEALKSDVKNKADSEIELEALKSDVKNADSVKIQHEGGGVDVEELNPDKTKNTENLGYKEQNIGLGDKIDARDPDALQSKSRNTTAKSSTSIKTGDTVDAKGQSARAKTKQTMEVVDLVSIPCFNDMLIMYASPAGKFAISGSSGGWLISGLYLMMKETYNFKLEDTDFVSFLLEVNHIIAKDKEFSPPENAEQRMHDKAGSKCVACITHMLQHDIYFEDSKLRPKKNIFGMCISGE